MMIDNSHGPFGRNSAPDAASEPRWALRARVRGVTREAMLDAAEGTFSAAPYDETRMKDIADAAGVAVGSLYNYFESKDAIFDAIVERGQHRYLARLEGVTREADGRIRLERVVAETLAFIEEHGALYSVYLSRGSGPESATERGTRDRFADLLRQCLRSAARAGHVRRDVGLDSLVEALSGLVRGAVDGWLAGGRRPGLAARAPAIVDLFWNGAAA